MSFPQLPFGGLRNRRVSIFSSNLVLEPVVLEVSASDIKFGVSNLAIDPVVLEVSASDIKFGVSNLAIDPVVLKVSASDIKFGVSNLAIDPVVLKVSASDIKFGVSNLAIDPVVLKVSASDIKFGVSNLIIPTILVGTSVAPPPPPSPTKRTYTPTELESYTYWYTDSNVLAINDGNTTSNGVMKAGGGTFGELRVLLTFASPTTLTSFNYWLGQFNGGYNKPTSVDIYTGNTINPSKLIQSSIFPAASGSLAISGASSSSTYVFNFKGVDNNISILELETFGV